MNRCEVIEDRETLVLASVNQVSVLSLVSMLVFASPLRLVLLLLCGIALVTLSQGTTWLAGFSKEQLENGGLHRLLKEGGILRYCHQFSDITICAFEQTTEKVNSHVTLHDSKSFLASNHSNVEYVSWIDRDDPVFAAGVLSTTEIAPSMMPSMRIPWGLDRLDQQFPIYLGDNAFRARFNGTGVNVYIIDSGIRSPFSLILSCFRI